MNRANKSIKGVSKIRETRRLSSGNMHASINGLGLVLQLSSMNEAEQQYHNQPVARCGAVFERKLILIMHNPFKQLIFFFKAITYT